MVELPRFPVEVRWGGRIRAYGTAAELALDMEFYDDFEPERAEVLDNLHRLIRVIVWLHEPLLLHVIDSPCREGELSYWMGDAGSDARSYEERLGELIVRRASVTADGEPFGAEPSSWDALEALNGVAPLGLAADIGSEDFNRLWITARVGARW